jgi:hypothetical protein
MKTTQYYLKVWKKALQAEIIHLKKYGSSKYRLKNGRLLRKDNGYTYYLETAQALIIPIGSKVRIEWGQLKTEGRMLSSVGESVIITLEQDIGDFLTELLLIYDPWDLLEQLTQRLDEIKDNKQKRARIKRLMDPSIPAKHPVEKITSNVHELVLRSKYNPITYVWGPPGTGKTYTLARVVANKYFKEYRVLVLAHSNQAVDVLMGELTSFVVKKERWREGDILRYGSRVTELTAHNELLHVGQLLEERHPDLAAQKERLFEERKALKKDLASSFSLRDSEDLLQIETKLASVLEKIRQKEIQFVKDAAIIGTTLAKAANDPTLYENDFDLVILDEASMAFVPQVAFAASLGKRTVICGDFKQLPPIASAHHPLVNEWLKEDVFYKAGVANSVAEGVLHPHLFLLKEQRRMHPDISAFTNKFIYHSLVDDHKSVGELRRKTAMSQPFTNRAAVLLDTTGTGAHCISEFSSHSRFNLWHLFLSFQSIHEAYLAGNRSIGFATPYRAQALFMGKLLKDLYKEELKEADIMASTIHRFQGSERDVMVFDSVDSFPQDRAGMLLTGKESERLINVAITRTKGKFIHVSNRSFIQQKVYQSKTLRQLIDYQVKMNQSVEHWEIGSWIRNQHPRLRWIHAKKLEGVMKDLTTARVSIIVSLPKGNNLTKQWLNLLNGRAKGVELAVVSNADVNHSLTFDRVIEHAFPFPFVMIDKQLLWLGVPLEGAQFNNPPFVATRLNSNSFCEYFLSQTFIV